MIYLCAFLLSFTSYQNDEWIAPESARRIANPTDPGDEEDLEYAGGLYGQHCKSCHGKKGLGDGPASKNLEKPSAKMTSEKFQSQSDGSIYYKISTGRGDMPGFDKKINEEDRWLVVNYLRTFKDKED